MKSRVLYIYTRTPLHVGSGGSVGAIDQPVQRERHTGHPIIPGSSIKGVIRNVAETVDNTPDISKVFGTIDGDAMAGDLTFGEARPLAFPVRSAKGAFAYITCPVVISRWARDAGIKIDSIPSPGEQECLAGSKVTIPSKNTVVLEEYSFKSAGMFPEAIEEVLKGVIPDPVWQEAAGRLVMLEDGDFSHFVTTATEISHHNKIEADTGTVKGGALFDIESVPAETLFFSHVTSIGRYEGVDSAAALDKIATAHPVLQFGGHSSTGLGFCSVNVC